MVPGHRRPPRDLHVHSRGTQGRGSTHRAGARCGRVSRKTRRSETAFFPLIIYLFFQVFNLLILQHTKCKTRPWFSKSRHIHILCCKSAWDTYTIVTNIWPKYEDWTQSFIAHHWDFLGQLTAMISKHSLVKWPCMTVMVLQRVSRCIFSSATIFRIRIAGHPKRGGEKAYRAAESKESVLEPLSRVHLDFQMFELVKTSKSRKINHNSANFHRTFFFWYTNWIISNWWISNCIWQSIKPSPSQQAIPRHALVSPTTRPSTGDRGPQINRHNPTAHPPTNPTPMFHASPEASLTTLYCGYKCEVSLPFLKKILT